MDLERVRALEDAENARFITERPQSMALQAQARRSMPRGVPMAWMDDLYEHPPVWVASGAGARFTDVDGHTYLDMYVADMSAFCGHAPAPVVEAVARRMGLGNQFLLPGEDAIAVAEHLAGRYGLPKWQFTLSATQANTEVIRLARELTGREIVLMFDAKYHGEGDATLVIEQDGELIPESRGLPAGIAAQARIVQFNDSAALEAALAPGDVALVLAEPAMTNAGFLLPQPGFLELLRRATRDAGTLLALDETHTLVCAYGGLVGDWGLEPDFLVLGKSIAAGVPLATYGMREEIASLIAPPAESRTVSGAFVDEVATGGTLFANLLSMAAGRAALLDILTESAFEHTATLGAQMADGLRTAIGTAGLRWSVAQYGGHASYFFAPTPPTDGAASRAADDPGLRALVRVFMANRGVWESGWWLGPTVSVAHDAADVDRYVELVAEFLAAVT
ncbi:MAG TPA: transaminase [Solirubrobacteraceae bacterium]|nr:transaminase [Solirubrobacteraceae bacterium]